jgi:phage FluMu protein Com
MAMSGKVGDVIKCKNVNTKTGRECGRFLMKKMEDGAIHIKCPNCAGYAIIEVDNNALNVFHVDKNGEKEICKKKI